ncbi:MAG: metal transporter [Blastopirellula sp.]|nr:MAG: metal transporter [Blastopirellula sp.]
MSTQEPTDTTEEIVEAQLHPEINSLQSKPWIWWLLKLMVPCSVLFVGLLLIFAMGLAQRVGWITAGGSQPVDSSGGIDKVFTCPMHPQIRQPTEGRCPICGMALVDANAGGAADLDELSVKIDPAQRRLANIQTEEVKLEPVISTIETIGAIAIDESRMATISSYIDGRLERLFADYTGVDVAQGDHLAVIYSPELYTAQVEYLESQKSFLRMGQGTLEIVRSTQERLVRSSRQKLIELGMTEEQVRVLIESNEPKTRLTIYAPMGGTVTEKLAVEGKYVKAGEPIYRIANLSTVWLKLELFPEDASRIRFGQLVNARVQSLPNKTFQGRIAFIDPTVNALKRTVGVRVEFLNNDRSLRPGDYASASISIPIGQTGKVYDAELAGRWISPMHPQIIRDSPGPCPICGMDLIPTTRFGYTDQPVDPPKSIYVPRSALLMAGSNSVVYVETEPGRFSIRPVTIGPILKDKVVILKGLEKGEKVATAGNFLIDSQMQLGGKPSLIDPTRAIAALKKKKGPLEFEHIHVTPVTDKNGDELEQLYQAYFTIQSSLAADQKPTPMAATSLHQLSLKFAKDEAFSDALRKEFTEIAGAAEHLHHMDIDKARISFKPISHAVVSLATQVRGKGAQTAFTHFYCPHVKEGGGDWLQANDQLINPYYGSQMLRCGNKVHQFPVNGHLESDAIGAEKEQSNQPMGGGTSSVN